jgi:hypothetical protein
MTALPGLVRNVLVDQFWRELQRLSQETQTGVAQADLDRIYAAACGMLDLIDQLRQPEVPDDDDELLDLDELIADIPAPHTTQ